MLLITECMFGERRNESDPSSVLKAGIYLDSKAVSCGGTLVSFQANGNCTRNMSLCLIVSRLMENNMDYKIVENRTINCGRDSSGNIRNMKNLTIKVSSGDFVGFQFDPRSSGGRCSLLPDHVNNTEKQLMYSSNTEGTIIQMNEPIQNISFIFTATIIGTIIQRTCVYA